MKTLDTIDLDSIGIIDDFEPTGRLLEPHQEGLVEADYPYFNLILKTARIKI